MARPGRRPGFSEVELRHTIRDAFWQHGYEPMTVRRLADAAGVLPGSLYAALGEKRTMYLEALREYGRGAGKAAAELSAPEASGEDLARWMVMPLDAAESAPGRGCMLGNAAVEFLPEDDAVAEVVTAAWDALDAGAATLIRRAQDAGEVRADVDADDLAALMRTLQQGLHVTGRDPDDVPRLRRAAQQFIELLRPDASGSAAVG